MTAPLQSLLNLPGGVEIDFDDLFFSRLPAQHARSYQPVDAHFSWLLKKSLRFTVAGENLLQPQYKKFAGDNGKPGRHSARGGCRAHLVPLMS
jgi:hypothetical protein